MLQHLHELRENENFLAVGHERIEQFEQRVGLAAGGVAADERGMAADLAQARERGEHVHLALVQALRLDRLHHLVAAAAQFGQIQFALLVAQRAIAAFLDAVGQILRHVFLQAAQQQRAQLGRKPPARDALVGLGVFAARLVGFQEIAPGCRDSRAGRNPRCSTNRAAGFPAACRSARFYARTSTASPTA